MPSVTESQLRQARAELESGLLAGEDRRAEVVLAAYPAVAADTEAVLELVYTEFVVRQQLGQNPDPSDLVARFPQLRGDLEQMFQVHDELCKVEASRPEVLVGRTLTAGGRPLVVSVPRIPGYEVEKEVGRGGMGVVFKARQAKLNRTVALKVILSGEFAGSKERARFRREVEAAARLDHPNIVHVFEVGEHDGRPFCAMEFVDGGTLADRLTGKPWPGREAAALVAVVARAADHAHRRGVVHRDLKPANILIAPNPAPEPPADATRTHEGPAVVPKIADFGLAKCLTDSDARGPTRTGDFLGTPAYMAPEQARGMAHHVGPAADVWALGVILYEMLTGRSPFAGEAAAEVLQNVQTEEPVPPSRLQHRIPRDLETVCLKCLRKDPRRRYGSAAELADDLHRYLVGRSILARPTPWWEKTAKWCRRQPLAATVLGLLVLTAAVGISGITWQWLRAERRATEAQQEREAKVKYSKELERRLYFLKIARAQQAWLENRPMEANRLLDDCERETPDLCDWEWRYLRRAWRSAERTFAGHEQEVRGLVVTPDGRRMISATGVWVGSQPGRVFIWDTATGERLRPLDGVGPGVHFLALHPAGRRLAAATKNGTARLWDLEAPDQPPVILGNKGGVLFAVSFSSDGNRLACGHSDSKVRVWDLKTNTLAEVLDGHTDNVFTLAFSPDGRWLASGARDGRMILRDAVSLNVRLPPYEGRYDGRPDALQTMAFSADSRWLAAGSFHGRILVWDLHKLDNPPRIYLPDSGGITALAFSPDSHTLAWATAVGPGSARVMELASGRTLAEFRGHDIGVLRLAFSPDGQHLYTGGYDGTVRRWDLVAPSEPVETDVHNGYVYSFAYSPDGRYLAAAGGYNTAIPYTSQEMTLHLVRTDGSEPTRRFVGHKGWLTSVAYHPNGQQIASGDEDGMVIVWDVANRVAQHPLKCPKGAVHSVAYTHDGESLLSGGDDPLVRVWDPHTGDLRYTLEGHTGPVTGVACCPKSRRVATASLDGTIRVWNLDTREVLHQFHGPTGFASPAVAFSPDGQLLACGFSDWTVKIVETESGRPVHETGEPLRLAMRFTDELAGAARSLVRRPRISLAFSPNGRRLATVASRCAVQLWDVQSGQVALTLPHQSHGFTAVTFLADGDGLAGTQTTKLVRWSAGERRERPTRASMLRAWHTAATTSAEREEAWSAVAFHERYLCEFDPTNMNRWSRLAMAHLACGDMDSYEGTCAAILWRFGETDKPSVAGDVIYNCTAAPLPPAYAALLPRLGKTAMPAFQGNERAYGAALYRVGAYAEAREQFDRSGAKFGRRVWDWLFLAMIHHRLDDSIAARDCYDKAISRMNAPNPYFHSQERSQVEALKREAEQLLGVTKK